VEAHTFLLQLLVILVAARVCGELVASLGAPSVIGELLAGILIGPSLFGWVAPSELLRVLAEVGVILLLFEVGLETDMSRLLGSARKSVTVAMGGFLAPLVVGYAVSHYLFGLSPLVSLFVGGTLTATSIGITVRVLLDVHRQNSPEGEITLGAAVLDDLMGVILLAILYEFSVTGEVNWFNAARVLGYISVFFLIAPILAKLMSRVIGLLDQRIDNPGLIPVTIVSLVLFFAWLAHLFGAPELLGGFAAGLALSRRFFLPFGLAVRTDADFAQKVEGQMKPIVQLFTPIFFVMVGLSLDLREVDWSSWFFWSFSLVLLLVAIGTKFTGALLISESLPRRFLVGMAMVPRGEVGLIFAGLGSAAGVFAGETYTALVMVIAYTTLLSPFWIKMYYRRVLPQLEAEEQLGSG
jgi:Kef-type K+ transport system membrane component KefB